MEVFKSFRLFGLYFYVSSVRMKKRSPSEERWRNQRALYGYGCRVELLLVQKCG